MAASEPQAVIDTRALEIAIEAKVRGESHENTCVLKHEAVQAELVKLGKGLETFKGEIKQDVKRLFVWVIGGLLSIICALFFAIISLGSVILKSKGIL